MTKDQSQSNNAYLFQVELLVSGESNALALEKLLHELNKLELLDYKINAGIQLGSLIDGLLARQSQALPVQQLQLRAQPPLQAAPAPVATPAAAPTSVAAVAAPAAVPVPEVPAAQQGSSHAKDRRKPPGTTKASAPAEVLDSAPAPVIERIKGYIASNRLIRVHVNKGMGVKLSIPCRIINFDAQQHNLTVYHVDEKQVYTFSMFEIDDFDE